MNSEAEFRRLYEANRAAVHAYFTARTGDPQQAAGPGSARLANEPRF